MQQTCLDDVLLPTTEFESGIRSAQDPLDEVVKPYTLASFAERHKVFFSSDELLFSFDQRPRLVDPIRDISPIALSGTLDGADLLRFE